MNRAQIVWIIGGSMIGAVGLFSTWYAGRESYKRGLIAGRETVIIASMNTQKTKVIIKF